MRATTEFLNLTPAPSRNGFRNLKFTPKLNDGFEISKFALASARLADIAQNFISRNGFKILKLVCEPPSTMCRTSPRADKAEAGRGCGIAEKRRAVKPTYAGGYLNSARRYIVRFCSAAVRHGYKVGREEKFSKFGLTNALLNFISLLPRKFKPALLKFAPEVPRNRSEILNFMFASYKLKLALRKFTPEPRKIKPTPAVRLNFALNSVPPARAAKFENGVKFKAVAKFERSAR